jgi:sugar lactone lactonase YvrE
MVLLTLTLFPMSRVDAEVIDFESDAWVTDNAEVTDYMGRESLSGSAYLKDVELQNGTIEFDLNVKRARSYPGVFFRTQSLQNYERIYFRPHRFDFYPDAIQYTPVINGIAGWQLYNGEGYTAGLSIPYDEWVHVKLVVAGSQARLYVNDSDVPSLAVQYLKHGVSKGSIALNSPRDGSAYFSNFEYTVDDDLQLDPAPEVETPPGTFTSWDLSQSFKVGDVDLESPPGQQDLGEFRWQEIQSEPSGLVDVARHVPRSGREPDCIFTRTTLHSDEERVMEIQFGYSDFVSIFLNDRIVFSGNSAYRNRDPSFLGIVGFNDYAFLPLEEGDNELVLMVAESFGGWGFMCRDGDAIFQHADLEKVFELPDDFLTPESVVYDSEREVFYVSNFDSYNRGGFENGQFLSKVSRAGEVENLKWVPGLSKPTGMVISGSTLYVIDRGGLVGIDLETGEILDRHPIPQARFLNDVTVDPAGRIYVSDSGGSVIYRFVDGEFEEWLAGNEVINPNGLFVHDGKLLFGNTGDHRLKAADLETRAVTTVAQLGPGFIDGITIDELGRYLVSLWEGRVYRISTSGELEKILDTSVPGMNTADFEYITEERLLVIPTFTDNRLVSYRLSD